MGYFLAASAFRTQDCDLLQDGIITYSKEHHSVCAARAADAPYDERTDARVYAPSGDWIRVLWPAYFNLFDFRLCTSLASRLGLTVSTVHVYDSDFWEHLFLKGDETIHRYSSCPDYFGEDSSDAAAYRAVCREDPHAMAALLNVPAEQIAAYFERRPREPAPPPRPVKRSWIDKLLGRRAAVPSFAQTVVRAYPADRHAIDDFWVFTDFWRQIGIAYPEPVDQGVHSILRFDDINKLQS